MLHICKKNVLDWSPHFWKSETLNYLLEAITFEVYEHLNSNLQTSFFIFAKRHSHLEQTSWPNMYQRTLPGLWFINTQRSTPTRFQTSINKLLQQSLKVVFWAQKIMYAQQQIASIFQQRQLKLQCIKMNEIFTIKFNTSTWLLICYVVSIIEHSWFLSVSSKKFIYTLASIQNSPTIANILWQKVIKQIGVGILCQIQRSSYSSVQQRVVTYIPNFILFHRHIQQQ